MQFNRFFCLSAINCQSLKLVSKAQNPQIPTYFWPQKPQIELEAVLLDALVVIDIPRSCPQIF